MIYSHYDYDRYSPNGKRQPCPYCESKTGFTGRYCFACKYRPNQENKATYAPYKTSGSLKKCVCGNDLKSHQKRCFYCLAQASYERGRATPEVLAHNEYAKRKQLDPHLLREAGVRASSLYAHDRPCLIYPLTDGELKSYQVIFNNGEKKYAYPPHQAGSFFHTILGNPLKGLVECEGLATGISLQMGLKDSHDYAILVAGDANGLIKGARRYREQIKIIAADNDKSQTGFDMAYQAASICGAKVMVCPVDSDYNDLHCQQGLKAVTDDFDAPHMGNLNLNLGRQARLEIEVIPNLEEFVANEGITLLVSAMGTGKTKIVIADLVKKCLTLLYVSYLRSLDSDASQKLGLISYQLSKAVCKKMSVCINSIEKYNHEFEILAIDEIHAVLDTLSLSKSTIREQKRTFDDLVAKISQAKYTVTTTATLNLAHLYSLKTIAAMTNKPLKMVINTQPGQEKVINLAEFEQLTNKWQTALANKEKVYLFCDSPKNVKTIAAQARQMFPQAKILAIHGGNSGDHMHTLAQSYTQYDMVIVSPSLTAGVSLETEHFDLTMAWFIGNHLSPLDAIQALARYRPAKEVWVCLDKRAKIEKAPHFEVTQELEKIKTDYVRQLETIKSPTNYDLDEGLKSYEFTPYDRICIISRTQAAIQKQQFKPQLLMVMEAQGWRVSDQTRGDGRGARRAHQITKTEVIMAECIQIAATPLISPLEAEILANKLELSEPEQYALKRYQAATIFQTNDPVNLKAIFENDLIHKAHQLAQYQSPQYTRMKFEQTLAQVIQGKRSIVQAEPRIAEREFIATLFQCVGMSHSENGLDFDQATFSLETDFNLLKEVIKKYNFFARKRTDKMHVLAANELRKLGFIVTATRAKGKRGESRPYVFTVTGINPLVEIGMTYFSQKFSVSISRQMILTPPIAQNGHIFESKAKSEPIGSLLEPIAPPPCRHDPIMDMDGQPTCPTCNKTWPNYTDYMTEFIEHGGRY